MGIIEERGVTVLVSFTRYGISTNLDGSEDGEFSQRIASASTEPARGPEAQDSIEDNALQLVFDFDSDASFDALSNDE